VMMMKIYIDFTENADTPLPRHPRYRCSPTLQITASLGPLCTFTFRRPAEDGIG